MTLHQTLYWAKFVGKHQVLRTVEKILLSSFLQLGCTDKTFRRSYSFILIIITFTLLRLDDVILKLSHERGIDSFSLHGAPGKWVAGVLLIKTTRQLGFEGGSHSGLLAPQSVTLFPSRVMTFVTLSSSVMAFVTVTLWPNARGRLIVDFDWAEPDKTNININNWLANFQTKTTS